MQVILHIGTDKTGSTSIQNTLFLNRDWLQARSIYVPTTGLGAGNGHSVLLRNLDEVALGKLAGELRTARELGYQRALLSWEGMGSFRFGRAHIRRLLAALGDSRVHILVYLREQAEIIQSGHLQRVKRNRNRGDIRSLAQPGNPLQFLRAFVTLRNPNRNYYRLLRRWQGCIPGATFAVRIFNKAQLLEGDVVADFLGQLDVAKDANFLHARPDYNPSLDVEGALLLESLQKNPAHTAAMETLVDLTQSVIAAEGRSSKYFLDESAVMAIRKHFRRSNLKLARRFMGSEEYPFRALSQCWRDQDLAALECRARELARRVEEVSKTPTLMGTAQGAGLASMVELSHGWSDARDWGVWSVGSESRIRFRLFRHRLLQEVSSVRLRIEGRYYGNNRSTRVWINGQDFGEQNLAPGACELLVPVSALKTYEILEITLGHREPASPFALEGTPDKRALSFGLEAIGYELLRSA